MARFAISAVIAAAGSSTRMGMDKALMPIEGMPAIRFSSSAMMAIKPASLIITLPPALLVDGRVSRAMGPIAHLALPNRYSHLGYAGSVRTAVEQLGPDINGVLITPVDSPIFSRPLLKTMSAIAKAHVHRPLIMVPCLGHRHGHPIYFSKHIFDELMGISGADTLQTIIARRKDLIALYWPDPRILLNINRPEDLKRGNAKSFCKLI